MSVPLSDLGFDPSNIDVEALRFIISSPAYDSVFKPFLEGMERGMTQELIDPSVERKWAKNDDYLRGGIVVIRALLNMPDLIIADDDLLNEEQRRIENVEKYYNTRAHDGRMAPMGFEYNADEDY